MNNQKILKACFAEFFGTFILVLAAILTIFLKPLYHALIIVFVLLGLIYIFGVTSGAYFNPAITVAVYLDQQITKRALFLFTICQILGGFMAAVVATLIIGSDGISSHGSLTQTYSILAFFIEFIITFCLTLVVLTLTSNNQNYKWTPVVVITLLFCLIILSADLTGASLNPARSIGASILEHKINYLWIYVLGPILGALSSYLLFSKLHKF